MCTVLLPPGGYPTAVNKYITSYSYTDVKSVPQDDQGRSKHVGVTKNCV